MQNPELMLTLYFLNFYFILYCVDIPSSVPMIVCMLCCSCFRHGLTLFTCPAIK